MIKNILFDLDGTLLPMDQDTFVNYYFMKFTEYLEPHGYDKKTLIDTVWKGTKAMIINDGKKLNEEVFWDIFYNSYGQKAIEDRDKFELFYDEMFDEIRPSCGFNPLSKKLIDSLKNDYHLILATNPVFPKTATYKRIAWAGLEVSDFEYITTYENSAYCKPNPEYYKDICEKLNLNPSECLMIGNDVKEDMSSEIIRMNGYLILDDLINDEGKDISRYQNSNLEYFYLNHKDIINSLK